LLLIALVSLLRSNTAPAPAASNRSPRLRPLVLRIAGILLAIGLAVLTLHLSGCAREEVKFNATVVRDANFGKLAALESLTDATGQRVASVDFSGRVVVVFFGYTQCPDVCPTTLMTMQTVMRLLGDDAPRVQVFFVTLDPQRDTPEILQPYVTWFDKRFRALRGDNAATVAIAKEFRVYFNKVARSDGSYSLDHTATSYVYDPEGRMRLLLRLSEPPDLIAADLKQLLAGK
jgi:protein SCO1